MADSLLNSMSSDFELYCWLAFLLSFILFWANSTPGPGRTNGFELRKLQIIAAECESSHLCALSSGTQDNHFQDRKTARLVTGFLKQSCPRCWGRFQLRLVRKNSYVSVTLQGVSYPPRTSPSRVLHSVHSFKKKKKKRIKPYIFLKAD